MSRVPSDSPFRVVPKPAACDPTLPDEGLPGCDTGPAGRLSFVVGEIVEIIRNFIARGGHR